MEAEAAEDDEEDDEDEDEEDDFDEEEEEDDAAADGEEALREQIACLCHSAGARALVLQSYEWLEPTTMLPVACLLYTSPSPRD